MKQSNLFSSSTLHKKPMLVTFSNSVLYSDLSLKLDKKSLRATYDSSNDTDSVMFLFDIKEIEETSYGKETKLSEEIYKYVGTNTPIIFVIIGTKECYDEFSQILEWFRIINLWFEREVTSLMWDRTATSLEQVACGISKLLNTKDRYGNTRTGGFIQLQNLLINCYDSHVVNYEIIT